MNTKNKALIIMALALLVAPVTRAQVREFNIGAGANTIVRSVDGSSTLIYTEDNSSEAWFLFYRDGDATAKAFRVGPGVQVRDVRIYDGKTAYFCGTYNSGTNGVVGLFDILPTFAGSGSVTYGLCDWSTGTYKVKPTDLKRLDLLDSAGTVCMAMVGNSLTNLGWIEAGTTVMSAWYNGSWHGLANYKKAEDAQEVTEYHNMYTYVHNPPVENIRVEIICENNTKGGAE